MRKRQKTKLHLRYWVPAALILIYAGNSVEWRTGAPDTGAQTDTASIVVSERTDTTGLYDLGPQRLQRAGGRQAVVRVEPEARAEGTHSRDCVDGLQEMAQVFTLWFDSGSATIGDEGRDMLRIIGTAARDCPEAHVVLGGHSDAAGSEVANLRISRDRANAAMRVLKALQLDVANIEPIGFGATLPYAQGDAGEDAENRRVDFEVIRRGAP